MREHSNATVLAFTKGTQYLIAIASFFTKNRIVVSERNDPYTTPSKKSRRLLRDLAFSKADKCVFQTADAKGFFSKEIQEKGIVIPNPINPDLPDRYIGDREKKIVAVGRLHPQKNFGLLIRAFSCIHKDYPEYKLVIYGRGNQENELRALISALDLNEYVELPGFSDDIYQDILKSSVYVSSSDYEGMSNSMLEALALGIPSVVTDCPIGGARMIIKNNVNGILVPVGDEKAMYDAIRRILSDKKFADMLSDEAYKIRADLPVEKIAREWLELF